MELKYDIPKYIAKTKISSKKRILVEGKDDKSHVKNLLDMLLGLHEIRIDTAENIKGNCEVTSKNNRAKIEKIFQHCKVSEDHKTLFFLCDREFYKFNIENSIQDLMLEHEVDGNFSWTLGHSLENYFFRSEILEDAYRYLSGSMYKTEAIKVFINILPEAFKVIAVITLAARELSKSSFPAGVVGWQNFIVSDFQLKLDLNKGKLADKNTITDSFKELIAKYEPIIDASTNIFFERICRGHTAMILLQRIFAACLYFEAIKIDQDHANYEAYEFSKIGESTMASALCESWVRLAKIGSVSYPDKLIRAIV